MEHNESKFEHLFANRRFSAAFALLMAILLWVVVITLQPNTEKEITNIDVNLDYNSASYTGKGLDIVDRPDVKVRVKVKGDGTDVLNISAADLMVYPDYTTVTGEGTYTLKLEAKINGTSLSRNVDIEKVIPDTITLDFDKIATKKFPIQVSVTGLEVGNGYYADTPTARPGEVTLRGPESEINRIEKVLANVAVEGERTDPLLAPSELEYLDKSGNPVDSEYITADVEQVEVEVPVLKMKEVPLTFEFTGVPAGYDPSQLSYTMSQNTIRVAGSQEQVDALESISAGIIDLTTFVPGTPITLNITLSEGLRNVDSLQTVTVEFDTRGYTTKTVSVTDIRVINASSGVTVTPTTQRINSVTLVGLETELETLSSDSVVAVVDASSDNLVNMKKGQLQMNARILVPGAKSVFATGSYTVLCDINTQS